MNKNKKAGKIVEILITAEKGESHKVTSIILKKYRDDKRNVTTTINRKCNVTVDFVYRNEQELHDILQDIRTVPDARMYYKIR